MRRIMILIFVLIFAAPFPAQAEKAPTELIADAVLVLREMADQPDSEHLQSMLKSAYGVAIFPSVVKAGLGLGGRFGDGLILEYDRRAGIWHGPYFVSLRGLSYGFQIGLQSTALVLVVTSERGMASLKEEKITLGGNLSIAAGPLGRSAEAGTDLKMKASIYSYSISKGAFVGASLEGAAIRNKTNANHIYWGRKLSPGDILSNKAAGEDIKELLDELNSIIAQPTGGEKTA
ncbi:MAG TPA: lipid-binding SYLF domain-containing protein [Firmicutes bacterium]|nr:lipid-binding SYLF domain-containing protein [Bacillota bacterium]